MLLLMKTIMAVVEVTTTKRRKKSLDETKIGMTEIINYINQYKNLDFDDIQHPCHTDLIMKYISAYQQYQSNLYKQIIGIKAPTTFITKIFT